ncbi:fumarylacetoacetate hydrolase family protein [Mycolicibacterium sp. 120266]|uniref:fumarylacetoacetate hydrolase family protein n=1 Tax=Mycolicibacterium sp. 120266 TaxID=3090601 RepID=UPI00299D58D4|nr:fumarylacetoacetate hydrolase family protein [Mycolicibacterium sp. 120266]MDX1872077.1 fumarylacetoacetate hydrolase family protein [Mycolicibacterium sp. 120266]
MTRFAQTTQGVARIEGENLCLLDLALSLDDLIRGGQLDRALNAPVRDVVAVEAVPMLAPVRRPGKICIVGLNYADHACEIGADVPSHPRFHFAVGSAVSNPGDAIVLPELAAEEVDYEGEVALIMGTAACRVTVDDAWRHAAGLTAANDVSARDVQLGRRAHAGRASVPVAKSFDSFKPLGPCMMSADDVDTGEPLVLRTYVDDELRQQASTTDMIFGFAELISEISHYVTLEPGDVILTGTPAGVAENTGKFLKAGQTVRVEIDGIGALSNPVRRMAGESLRVAATIEP